MLKHLIKFFAWLILFLLGTDTLLAQTHNEDNQYWPVIHEAFFSGKPVLDGSQFIHIEAPERAEDAAVVPFTFSIDQALATHFRITKVYLFVDANPIQLTAIFDYLQPQQPIAIATRIRLEKTSAVRVVAESVNGAYWMHHALIKTSGGGCGGGLTSDEAKLRAEAGKMKVMLSQPPNENTIPHTLRFHIKHPMRTGFERTSQGYYAKAYYIKDLAFLLDRHEVMHATLGVGVSADPYLAFEISTLGAKQLHIHATDNEGAQYEQAINLIDITAPIHAH